MADFIPSLWESVFVSGPTPTLLIATNATFALLQIVLLLLLAATYSVHFAILSVICGGLWWSINWFAAEVAAVRAEEEAKAKQEREREGDVKGAESADDEGESTEVEEHGSGSGLEASRGSLSLSGFEEVGSGSGSASGRKEEGAAVRQRNVHNTQDLSGEVSTDSEWEKVEDGR